MSDLRLQAEQQLNAGNYLAALELYTRLCTADEADAQDMLMLGSLQAELGQISAARQTLENSLALEESAEACYSLASVSRLEGDLEGALEACRKAIALDASLDEAHNLAAGLYGQLGDFENAARYARQAIALNPASVEAHMNYANACMQTGQLEDAVSSYVKVTHALPDATIAWLMIGKALSNLGKYEDSIQAFQKAYELEPDNPDVLGELALAYQATERYEEAELLCRRGLTIAPSNASLQRQLGHVLYSLGHLDEAQACFEAILRQYPQSQAAMTRLGNFHRTTGNFEKAEEYYGRAVRADATAVGAHKGLGLLYYEMGQFNKAQHCFEKVIDLDGSDSDAHTSLGAVLMVLGEPERALASGLEALNINPDHVNAVALVANIEHHLGRTSQAYERIRPCIEKYPEHVNIALIFASVSKDLKKEDEAIRIIEHIRERHDANLSVSSQRNLRFSLAKLYDSIREYDKAFEHYTGGNRLKPVSFDPQEHTIGVDAQLRLQDASFFRSCPRATNQSEKPVFIVGMPRSGTSLVEQILSSHPDVHGGGELRNMVQIVAALPNIVSGGKQFPYVLSDLTQELIDSFAENYLRHLDDLSPRASRVTDKMPGNFMNLGLIQQMFPKARVIHCMRNPIDTCLSCYFQDFTTSHPYSYDLDNLAYFYGNYRRVMEHWKSVLRIPILDVQYEEMVADQEGMSRRLVDFCGLGWDEHCLSFYATDRFVGTASYEQVRKPIYRSSVERWRNYESHIQSLVEQLETFRQSPWALRRS